MKNVDEPALVNPMPISAVPPTIEEVAATKVDAPLPPTGPFKRTKKIASRFSPRGGKKGRKTTKETEKAVTKEETRHEVSHAPVPSTLTTQSTVDTAAKEHVLANPSVTLGTVLTYPTKKGVTSKSKKKAVFEGKKHNVEENGEKGCVQEELSKTVEKIAGSKGDDIEGVQKVI